MGQIKSTNYLNIYGNLAIPIDCFAVLVTKVLECKRPIGASWGIYAMQKIELQ